MSSESPPLIFQIKDIVARDVLDRPEKEEEDSPYEDREEYQDRRDRFKDRFYQMTFFGTQEDGKSVALTVKKYRPFFYVRIPDVLADDEGAKFQFKAWVDRHIPESVASHVSLTYESHAVLFDYNGGNKGCFLLLQVPSQAMMRHLKDKFLDKNSRPLLYSPAVLFGPAASAKLAAASAKLASARSLANNDLIHQDGKIGLKVYESNLDPMLRFCHVVNISPAGWVRVSEWEPDDSVDAKVAVRAVLDYEPTKPGETPNLTPCERPTLAPFKVASWDIECMSSHGDFPIAVKNYRKPIRELLEHGLPATLREGCKFFATAINDKDHSSVLSRIYLKNPRKWIPATAAEGRWGVYTADALYESLVSKGIAEKAEALWKALKTGTAVATTNLFTKKVESDEDTDEDAPPFEPAEEPEDTDHVCAACGHTEFTCKRFLEHANRMNQTKKTGARHVCKPLEHWCVLCETADSKTCEEYIRHTSDERHRCFKCDLCASNHWNKTAYLEHTKDRKHIEYKLAEVLSSAWPEIEGDEIIQIGTVLYCQGVAVSKHIWVLGTVDEEAVKPPGASVPIHVNSFDTEAQLLHSWFAWVGRTNPDILLGYNLFGFDCRYLWQRLEERVGVKEAIRIAAPLSCLKSKDARLEEKFLSSSAMGDNTMHFISSPGRLQIDLLPYIRRNHNLDSYSLDNVSATFVSGAVKDVVQVAADRVRFLTKSTKGMVVGRYVTLMDDENDRILDRALVVAVEDKALTIAATAAEMAEHGSRPTRWAQVKDDVSPKDIFKFHRGTAADRAKIARYCLQDCDLVMELFNKLEILNNCFAMANVCSVPVSFIFLRGQGIKIESLIFKECRKADQLIEVLYSPARGEEEEDQGTDDTYEGAIVLDPKTGVYMDPVSADDFSSLYPSSIISENISHDTLINVKIYNSEGAFLKIDEGSETFDHLPGAKYVDIEFDVLKVRPGDKRKHPEKIVDGYKVARYIQSRDGVPLLGTIPQILQMLLKNRKAVRKLAEKEPDEFRKALLDALQLAYKLTANSLYGQLGSGVFKVRRQVLAASTTGYGRKQLLFAKTVIEAVYGGGKDPRCDAEVVYGDTDSLFLRFRPKDPKTGVPLVGKAALQAAKDLTVESGQLVTSCLKSPHDFEFDKIFRTFCLLSKKRYVGDMSEDGIEEEDFHRKSMGIVMKRRDNAPIVKYVYGGAIDRMLNPTQTDRAKGVRDAAQFVKDSAKELLGGAFKLPKLTITKSLRANYADPQRIAHKVLADRIAARDPGNKPSTSDRIPFVYIQTPTVVKLQGDRIETPSYIERNKLKPDYAFYITNQIAKPVSQVFGLVVADLPGITSTQIKKAEKARDPVAAKEALAEAWLFKSVLMEAGGQRGIASFFGGPSTLSHV